MHYTVVHVLFDVNLAESSHPVPSRSSRSAYLVRPRLSREHGRAIYEWREAYAAAMGSRRSEALASVGDAALRIDALAGSRGVFRAEARDAYQGSMLLAHAQRDVRTMMRAADSLAQLGDTRAAERARQMAQGLARREAS